MSAHDARQTDLLAARATALARPVDELQDQDALELLLLAVGQQRVALPVEAVLEVRTPGPVAQVPGSNGVLVGLVSEHGDPLAVASLDALLELPSSARPEDQWVVVLDHPTALLGLLVDLAVDIITVQHNALTVPAQPDGLVRALLPDGTLLLEAAALLRDPRLSLTPSHPMKEATWHDR